MSSFRIRPRFEQTVPYAAREVEQRVLDALKAPSPLCSGLVIPDYIVLKIPLEDRHFWSPQLSLQLEEEEDGRGTLIRGLYGPNPTVWAFFTYGYGALAILGTFIGIIGLSELTLGKSGQILWVLALLAAMALGLYFIAQTGQKIGAQQTYQLHHFYEQTFGMRTPIH